MYFLASLRVATRIQLLVALTLIGLLTLCFTALLQLKESMLDDRKEKTRNLVEVGIGVLTHYHQLARNGKLSEEDAKAAARETLRSLRYGKGDYYFAWSGDDIY
jgi:methyl-accepting chemotaxis protein